MLIFVGEKWLPLPWVYLYEHNPQRKLWQVGNGSLDTKEAKNVREVHS
jgi:hypothetical protein